MTEIIIENKTNGAIIIRPGEQTIERLESGKIIGKKNTLTIEETK